MCAHVRDRDRVRVHVGANESAGVGVGAGAGIPHEATSQDPQPTLNNADTPVPVLDSVLVGV